MSALAAGQGGGGRVGGELPPAREAEDGRREIQPVTNAAGARGQ